jgi:hypothetical protein
LNAGRSMLLQSLNIFRLPSDRRLEKVKRNDEEKDILPNSKGIPASCERPT